MTTTFQENLHNRARDGKFTAMQHPESEGISLRAPAQSAPVTPAVPAAYTSPEFMYAVTRYQQSESLRDVAQGVREAHADAIGFLPSMDANDASVQYRLADGTTEWVEAEGELEDALMDFTTNGRYLAMDATDEHGYISFEQSDEIHRDASDAYAKAIGQAAGRVENERNATRYAGDLAREIAIRHRLAIAQLDGEDGYTRTDAEEFVDEDDLSEHAEFTRVVREAMGGATDSGHFDEETVADALSRKYGRGGWNEAVEQSTKLIPGSTPNEDGAMEVANGAYANTFIGGDGVPVVQVHTDGGYEGQIRVNVNDGAVYDADPEEE